MNVSIFRPTVGTLQTWGALFLEDQLFCKTLEDQVRVLFSAADKVKGETAIPCGVYQLSVNRSNRFKKFMPLVTPVKYFDGIRLHAVRDLLAENGDVVDTDGCPGLRPLAEGLEQGPTLTDHLVEVLQRTAPKVTGTGDERVWSGHMLRIIEGLRR